MRNNDRADTVIEVSVTSGSRARLELAAEKADELQLDDGDTVAALIGPTVADIEHRLAVGRWVDEGVDRDMRVEEFLPPWTAAPSRRSSPVLTPAATRRFLEALGGLPADRRAESTGR